MFAEKFPHPSIGRDAPAPGSPRYPDITPLDIFLFWCYIKTGVFATPVSDVKELEGRKKSVVCTAAVTDDSGAAGFSGQSTAIDFGLDSASAPAPEDMAPSSEVSVSSSFSLAKKVKTR